MLSFHCRLRRLTRGRKPVAGPSSSRISTLFCRGHRSRRYLHFVHYSRLSLSYSIVQHVPLCYEETLFYVHRCCHGGTQGVYPFPVLLLARFSVSSKRRRTCITMALSCLGYRTEAVSYGESLRDCSRGTQFIT